MTPDPLRVGLAVEVAGLEVRRFKDVGNLFEGNLQQGRAKSWNIKSEDLLLLFSYCTAGQKQGKSVWANLASFLGCLPSSINSSEPTILPPQVRRPSPPYIFSVTRFVEISPLWHSFNCFWAIFCMV